MKRLNDGGHEGGQNAYTSDVSVDIVKPVHILQPFRGVKDLEAGSGKCHCSAKGALTNFDLEAFGKRTRYSLKCPCGIHTDIIARGKVVVSTPRKGRMFGCANLPQTRTSW